MGFRFRRRVKLFPGVAVNVSATGISTSFGGPGATVNVGRRGTRATIGLPGTGVSYSERLSGPTGDRKAGARVVVLVIVVGALAVYAAYRLAS